MEYYVTVFDPGEPIVDSAPCATLEDALAFVHQYVWPRNEHHAVPWITDVRGTRIESLHFERARASMFMPADSYLVIKPEVDSISIEHRSILNLEDIERANEQA